MKWIISITLLFSSLFSETIELKEGWNLVGIASEDSATIFETNENITLVTGGGAGGSTMFYIPNVATNGSFKLGQGYWIKANADTSLTYTKETNLPSTIELKTGWNLIHPFNAMTIEDFKGYPEVTIALSGGAGNTNQFFYLPSLSGTKATLPNQGYWVKVSSDVVFNFSMYDYRAWGVGGDDLLSKSTIRINGLDYTIFAYSMSDIQQSEAKTGGNVVVVNGDINGKTFEVLALSEDYIDQNLKLKIYLSSDMTEITSSDVKLVANNQISFSDTILSNPNDYSVPNPEYISDDLTPPLSPTF